MKIMKTLKFLCGAMALLLSAAVATSCEDTKSYAELLDEENDAVEKFLETKTVINTIPTDTVFEVGENAPYYKLDEDGYVYMQVLNPGDGGMAKYNDVIFFRYSRMNILTWAEGGDQIPTGNDDNVSLAYSFNFLNTTLNSTLQYGTGIQEPLKYLQLNCHVNLIVKSKAGNTNDLTSVTPYLYNVRYFPSNI